MVSCIQNQNMALSNKLRQIETSKPRKLKWTDLYVYIWQIYKRQILYAFGPWTFSALSGLKEMSIRFSLCKDRPWL